MCTHTYLFLPILFACSKALQFAFHDKHQTKLVLLMGVTTITFPHLQAMPWNLRSEPLTMVFIIKQTTEAGSTGQC